MNRYDYTTIDKRWDAYRYYNDVSLWWIIAVANNLGKGKLSLDINKQLRIPTDIQTILQNFTLINS